MEPGTGKTRAAMELVSCTDAPFCLWLTPFQTKANLAAEIRKHGGLPMPYEIVGIETLSSSDREYLRLAQVLEAMPNAFVAVDESIKIKNWDAIRTKRITRLGQLAGYRLILNGTPVTRDLLDLWAQINFLSPAILNMGLAQFKSTYCETVKRTHYANNRIRKVDEWIVAYHNLEHLYSRINRYVYGCDLKVELQKHHHDIICMPSAEDEQRYQETKESFLRLEKIERENGRIFMAMVQKLQAGYSAIDSKVKAVRRIVEQHNGSCLIFCKYVATAETMRDKFPACEVMTIGTGAYGLNLQHHHVTVFMDQTWDYAQQLQAERRTMRTGQLHDCHYYHILTTFKLDGLIKANQTKKGGLLARLKEIGVDKLMEDI